ncbi:undecaprenyl-diphosphate phosphatase [Paenibacillus sp. MWE-103]|uniref:Undecaprenyl-diphosphatase n=1 Tax=Paenibacillus artemisiicola TaxID=1172618 RepID=A0ABS3WAG6_9BACL|nr:MULTISPECIES: undecaprenyl-diphosphate phosphatase [Paenibacillus]MBO7745293.1 undecaprenyl-diphosphate phosphatase [Paenibacillus artemisiicola]SFI92846.1 undecaprenyl-diphosphatase [Paenibacillus sp. UNC496MF]
MGDIIHSIILGIVEGLTEFLPVSSSGHMILTNKLLGIASDDQAIVTFEIIIQLAAILAMALVYRNRIADLFGLSRRTESLGTFTSGHSAPRRKRLNLIHVALGIVPAMLLAYVLKDVIKGEGFNQAPVLLSLVIGGIYMIVAEKLSNSGRIRVKSETMDDISYRQAFGIGLLQCLSLWPGFSRSGSTIAGGMLVGTSYKAAADFSFLMAIPIMVVASGYEMLDSYKYITGDNLSFFIVGFIVSFVVAWLVIVLFLRFIQKVRLTHFAIYRFILAAAFWIFVMR